LSQIEGKRIIIFLYTTEIKGTWSSGWGWLLDMISLFLIGGNDI
jgi:hypothetical protein